MTVFGFPPDAADYILQEFSHCGTIVHHSMDINTNWMHICYQSVLQAKKAQGKNCKILMSRMMVGVVPCTDDKLMQSYASLEQSEPISAQNVASPILSGQASVGLQRQRPASIRSMTVSYQQGAPEQMVCVSRYTTEVYFQLDLVCYCLVSMRLVTSYNKWPFYVLFCKVI